MKKLSVLTLFLLVVPLLAVEPKKEKLVSIKNLQWSDALLGVAASPGVAEAATNVVMVDAIDLCTIPGGHFELSKDQAFKLENFRDSQCPDVHPGTFDLVTVTVTGGSIDLSTEATYLDARGNYNYVVIPPLAPIAKLGSRSFDGTSNDATSDANFGIFSDAPQYVTLTVYDRKNTQIAKEATFVDKPAFYRLQTVVPLGRVVLTAGHYLVFNGAEPKSDFYAVQFIGKHGGGSPRVSTGR